MAHPSMSPAPIAPADTTTPTKLQLTHPPPQPKVLAGHASTVNALAFFPSGRQLISGSSDQTLRIWDVEAEEQIGPPLEGHDGIVQAVAVSRDGRVASGGFDRTVRVWDACSVSGNDGEVGKGVKENVMGEKQQEWTLTETFGTTGWVLSVDLSMDGKRVAAGMYNWTVQVWDINDGSLPFQAMRCKNAVKGVRYSLNAPQLAAAAQDLYIWD